MEEQGEIGRISGEEAGQVRGDDHWGLAGRYLSMVSKFPGKTDRGQGLLFQCYSGLRIGRTQGPIGRKET